MHDLPTADHSNDLPIVLRHLTLLIVASIFTGCAANVAEPRDAVQPEIAPQESNSALAERANSGSLRGKILFLQCRACHTLENDGDHLVGPNLSGLFGATAGQKQNFVYSMSLAESGVVWSEESLNKFLTRPNDYFPGTKMAFAGLESADDRRELIAYLASEIQ